MRYLFISVLLECALATFGADKPEYSASLIPHGLSKNAKAVVRSQELTIEMDKNSAIETHLNVITILNKNGYSMSIFEELYNSFMRLSEITIRIYDAAGDRVKSFSGSDILDLSAIDGYTLYADQRRKYKDPEYRTYPFTVEVSYKRKLKSLMFLPVWSPCNDYNVSVEKSKLTVLLPNDVALRYYESNIPKPCMIEETKGGKSYSWTVNDYTGFSREEFEAPMTEFLPIVYLSPVEFEIDGTRGSFASWNDFGKFIKELNAGRDTLLPSTVKKIQEVTQGLSQKKKIATIYQYMQQHTRYVSIQVGIGGWQPHDAMTVDRLAYGDCKDLSNYMYTLLKSVGISSHYTLIRAGNNVANVLSEFPAQFFNHAILTIPMDGDTLFLECTNNHIPCGFIGSFTDDRHALMITPEGGKLIHTRIYGAGENMISTRSLVTLNIEGSGNGVIKRSYNGITFKEVKDLSLLSNDEIKKEVYMGLNISDYVITGFSFNQPDESASRMESEVKVTVDQYASVVGNKLMVPLNFSNKLTQIPKVTQERKSPIFIRRPETHIDTVEYIIPHGYMVDKLPQEVSLSGCFADYHAQCVQGGDNSVLYIRKFMLNKGTYPSSDAQAFREFYTKVSQADAMKVALVKKL